MEPPVSVLFVDNTKNGMLATMLQKEEKRLGGITSYRVRIAESAGMALSRLLPSTNPWGQVIVDGKTVLCATSRMTSNKIAAGGMCCTRTNARHARWTCRGMETRRMVPRRMEKEHWGDGLFLIRTGQRTPEG